MANVVLSNSTNDQLKDGQNTNVNDTVSVITLNGAIGNGLAVLSTVQSVVVTNGECTIVEPGALVYYAVKRTNGAKGVYTA